MNNYTNYFKNHFNMAVSLDDIQTYRKWFISQWRYIKGKVSFVPDQDILEIGSGIGGFYSILKEYNLNMKYIGLELDGNACAFANKTFHADCFKNKSIEQFTSKELFQYIFAFEVLEHVENPASVIAKIKTLLKKDGIFVGSSPYPYMKNVYADETHRYVLHPSNWKKLFEDQGFSSVETFPMSFLPRIWRIHPSLNILFPFYISLPYCISTTLLIAKR